MRSRVGRVQLNVWVRPELRDKLNAAALDRGVPASFLYERLLSEGIERLIPAEEFTLTRAEP